MICVFDMLNEVLAAAEVFKGCAVANGCSRKQDANKM